MLLGIAGGVFAVLHGRHAAVSTPPAPPPATSPAVTTSPANSAPAAPAAAPGPAATVQAYVAAINAHDYAKAWALGGKNTGNSYSAFQQGFNGTAQDNLTVTSVTGNVVTAQLAAMQTDGSVKNYQGTYTVNNGVITNFDIRQTG